MVLFAAWRERERVVYGGLGAIVDGRSDKLIVVRFVRGEGDVGDGLVEIGDGRCGGAEGDDQVCDDVVLRGGIGGLGEMGERERATAVGKWGQISRSSWRSQCHPPGSEVVSHTPK